MNVAAILFVISSSSAAAFFPTNPIGTVAGSNSRRMLVPLDPMMLDMGIAVVSAAAGAALQLPKIQELEQDLQRARSALTESEEEMASKIKKLEEKLFLMDEEFEGQTEKIRKQYDRRMWDEIERVTDKLKTDYQYKLEIKMEEERSRTLKDQLLSLNQGSDSRGELAELRLRQTNVVMANEELQRALEQSEQELENLRTFAKNQKKAWWRF